MFGNDEKFDVTMLEPSSVKEGAFSENTYSNMVVRSFEFPVVEFEQFGRKIIVNLTSPRFVKAEKTA